MASKPKPTEADPTTTPVPIIITKGSRFYPVDPTTNTAYWIARVPLEADGLLQENGAWRFTHYLRVTLADGSTRVGDTLVWAEADDVRRLRVYRQGQRKCFRQACPRAARKGHWFCSDTCAAKAYEEYLDLQSEDGDSYYAKAWCVDCDEYVEAPGEHARDYPQHRVLGTDDQPIQAHETATREEGDDE